MAATGLLALLDDIAAMTKIAAKKTAGIAGDDLAVNAHAVAGGKGAIDPKRELPIVWEIAKGSFKNKFLYLIPGALALTAVAPWAIPPLMMAGGAYLCYEGVEKLVHKHGKDKDEEARLLAELDSKELEKKKIAGAIKTDVILSAEIVVVTLGAVAGSTLLVQAAALAAIGVIMTVGIYGLVGGLVKLDDIGLHMQQKEGDSFGAKCQRTLGKALVKGVPPMMKGLSVVGTAAMFMVGGGIILHGIPMLGHAVAHAAHAISSIPFVAGIVESGIAAVAGVATGFAAIPAVKAIAKPLGKVMDICKNAVDVVKDAMTRIPLLNKLVKKPAPSNDNKPAIAPPKPEAAPALANAPSPKADMAKAAQKVAPESPPPAHYPPKGEFQRELKENRYNG
jgi:predicted DNA repair protein MutK